MSAFMNRACQVLLDATGLASIVYGIGQVSTPAAFISVGAGLLALNYLWDAAPRNGEVRK